MASRKQQAAQARAQRRGFASVYQMRKFQQSNPGLNLDQSRINSRIFQEQGRIRRERVERRDALFARFNVTAEQYRRRDQDNREWFDKELRRRNKPGMEHLQEAFLKTAGYHTYRTDVADDTRWTEAKVGYVLSFYAANVARKTAYSSLWNDPLSTRRSKHFGQNDRQTVAGGFNKMNSAQYFYLTQYTDLMTVNEYEVSYGTQQTRQQAGASPAQAVA